MEPYSAPKLEIIRINENDTVLTVSGHGCCSTNAYSIETPELP